MGVLIVEVDAAHKVLRVVRQDLFELVEKLLDEQLTVKG